MISRFFLLITLLLAGCSPPTEQSVFPSTRVGITGLVRQQSQDFDWAVIANTNNIVTTETYWNSERIIKRQLYRGLYPIYGLEFGKSFEFQFDYKIIDQLFPLRVGKEVTFEGTMNLIEDNYQAGVFVHMQIVDKGIQQIRGNSYPVYIIEVTSRFSAGDTSEVTQSRLHYSFDLGLVVRSVTTGAGAQSYWRIRDITIPDSSTPRKRRRNPAGTVMI